MKVAARRWPLQFDGFGFRDTAPLVFTMGHRGKRAGGVIVICAEGAGAPASTFRNHPFCQVQRRDSIAVALDTWRGRMCEGRPMGRSDSALCKARKCLEVLLRIEPQFGASARTSSRPSLPLAWKLSPGRIDQRGLTVLVRRTQTIPDNWGRGIATAWPPLYVIFIRGSALRTAPRQHARVKTSARTESVANVGDGCCRYL